MGSDSVLARNWDFKHLVFKFFDPVDDNFHFLSCIVVSSPCLFIVTDCKLLKIRDLGADAVT